MADPAPSEECGDGSGDGVLSTSPALALRDAFNLMSQVLLQMQEAMVSINLKTERTDEAVHAVAETMKMQNRKLRGVEDRLGAVEDHIRGRDAEPEVATEAEGAGLEGEGAAPDDTAESGVQASLEDDARHAYQVLAEEVDRPSGSRVPLSLSLRLSSLSEDALGDAAAAPAPAPAPARARPSPRPAAQALRRSSSCAPATATAAVLGRALLAAAQDGHAGEVKRLLARGADVNHRNGSRWTALHKAALKAHPAALAQLLERGADANARTAYGFTALHLAAYNDRSGRCAALLVDAGCDLNARNQFGRAPLHYAAEAANEPALLVLVRSGAAKKLKDDEGHTPLDLAREEHIKAYLRTYTLL